MYRCIETLKDPQVVAKIQTIFGVSYNEPVGVASKCAIVDEEGARDNEEGVSMLHKKHRKNASATEVELGKGKEELQQSGAVKLANGFEEIATAASNVPADDKECKNYVIKNKFWYFLFLLGTYFGDELGYAIIIPAWFWNVDAKIGRKIVLVWTIIMYIGQTIKDIVCWPRPSCPPVIRLQKKWSLEHGMPSTHAMVGVALPSSVLYYTTQRYKFPIEYGVMAAVLWCTLISLSRLYLGMHSLLDVLAGLLLSSLLLIPSLPLMDYVGDTLVSYYWFPLSLLVISALLIFLYPTGNTWTPTRGDTTVILGTCVGIQTGSWLNLRLQLTESLPLEQPPYTLNLPEWRLIGIGILRTLLGFLSIVISFIIFEFITKAADWMLTKAKIVVRDTRTKRHVPLIDLLYKYLTYSVTAFHVVCTFPFLFNYFRIGRSSYYWE